ncbi:hypothetical protein ACIGXM_18225 [Kitasatospora sp. NPDC052896]|uniref:hypothetical protein n=1 Tax=Kitasatospora sp. NPDC052896 TaxID=3364061 RepID=UPI0037CC80FB
MLTAGVCFALTVVGLVIAGLHGLRRRWRTATRWAAVALLPAGVYLTGLVPVARSIGHAVADWAARLVFDPRVFVGIGLLALAVLLLLATRVGGGRKEVAESGAPRSATARPAAKQLGTPATPAKPTKGKSDDGLGDFSDIEEILRKRGI